MAKTDSVKSKQVYAKAPTRIDLAGGTLDIWPIAHILRNTYGYPDNNFSTINVAIDLYTHVEVSLQTNSPKPLINIVDRQRQNIYQGPLQTAIDLNDFKLVSSCLNSLYKDLLYQPDLNLTITTNSEIPRGSGLGGSSSLIMSLLGALNAILNPKRDIHALLTCAINIEAGLLNALAGHQDHFSAAFGGVQNIQQKTEGTQTTQLQWPQNDFMNHIILVHGAEEHFSATPNMDVIGKVLNKDRKILNLLYEISNISHELSKEFTSGNTIGVSKLINEEWNIRKQLSDQIESTKLSHYLSEAKKWGALGGKICGAGGGGVALIILEDPGSRETIEHKLSNEGGYILKASTALKGLEISHNPFD